MAAITDVASLKQQIHYLEQKQEHEKSVITSEIHGLIDSLKPGNLLRSLIHSVRTNSDLKSDILHGILGLGTGFLTNKLLLGSAKGPLKKIMATIIQAGITNAAVRYPETIKDKGISLLTKFLKAIRIDSDRDVENQHITGSAHL